MNSKIVAVWVSLAMVFGLIVIVDITTDFVPTVKGNTLYVNKTGSGGAYMKIQDAINASNDGDTVFIYNGTYYEHVIVNKSINLSGENRNTTIIDGQGHGIVVAILANWVNISDLKIVNSGSDFIWPHYDSGIELYFSNRTFIRNCNLSNNLYGIYLHHSSNNTIKNSNVSTNIFIGICLTTFSSNNLIFQNQVNSNDATGINIYSDSDNNIISNNIANYNTQAGIRSGYSLNNKIVNNTIISNKYGIYIDITSYNNIINNTVKWNTFRGIDIIQASNNIITNNDISLNNGSGIYLHSETFPSSNNRIEGNNIFSNNGDGIKFFSPSALPTISTYNLIKGNDIKDNFYGINISISENTSIISNNVSFSDGYGIYIQSSSNNNIISNSISSNGDYSIYIRTSPSNIVTGNHVFDGSAQGIRLDESSNNNIMNNTFTNNSFGIDIWPSCSYNNIINNTISLCPFEGISISAFSNNNVVASNIVFNNEYGIYLGKAANNTIENNNVYSNTFHGIYAFSNSYNNTFRFNYVHSNGGQGFYIGSTSYNNTIYANNFSGNWCGINLSGSPNNKVYHNNIVGNTIQGYDETNNQNQWDDGYPSGGNYWSDFDEPVEDAFDDYKGPDQNVTGSDGIVDNGTIGGGGRNPYVIDADSQDNFPLIKPFLYLILYQGWNLISIPLIQQQPDLTKVLASIDGLYDAVQWYNITDSNDPWKHYKIGKPFGNDLFELNETKSFWVHITPPDPIFFRYNGTPPTSNQTIPLHPGWNMVGYPSLTNHNRTEGLNNITFGTHVDAIWTYNAATQKWKELGPSDYFEPCRGYWVHAKVECEWEVPL